MKKAIIKLRNISKSFGNVRVIDNLSFDVPEGEFLTILGPSGCGKTTMLRIIAGFETPDGGSVELLGKDLVGLPANQREVNTVFQNYVLFPHMTVSENIGYGLRMKKVPKEEIDERVSEMLKLLRLESFAERKPSQLSGGQQQRVAIARGIINRPKVVLFDEPLGALDLQLRKQMQFELKRLQRRLGTTYIYVTHDQEEALTMSDRIIVMNAGKIEQIGTPQEVYNRPETVFAAQFLGESNLFQGDYREKGGKMFFSAEDFTLPVNAEKSGCNVLSLRPEFLHICTEQPEGPSFEGVITESAYLGNINRIGVRLRSGKIIHVLQRDHDFKGKNAVFVTYDKDRLNFIRGNHAQASAV